jgi:hypothetical protein
MKTTIYQNTDGIDCVAWTNENGQENSMLKSAYEEQQAQAEQSTPNLPA